MQLKFYKSFLKLYLTILLIIAAPIFLNAQKSTFISISDVHFDPYISISSIDTLVKSPYQEWDKIFHDLGTTVYSTYHEDTDYELFTSFLKELYYKSNKPDFIIFTGDFLAHDFLPRYQSATGDYSSKGSNSFIHKTFGLITSKITQHFPHIPIYFALGNNDSYTGDYNSVWNGEFFHQTAGVMFDNFIKNPNDKKSFNSTYSLSGSYSLKFKNQTDKRIISLNANFLSQKSPPNESAHGKDVLDWFKQELDKARQNKEKVWVINHIPPGIDVFDTMDPVAAGSKIDTALIFMTENYNDTLVATLKNYSDVITACFAGHIHMDDFRLFKEGTDLKDTASVFVHITPSISPKFGNNPAFEIFSYDKSTFELLDYDSYNFSIATSQGWSHQYEFNTTYSQTGINKTSLNSVFNNIWTDAMTRNYYIKYYSGSSTRSSIRAKWLGNWSGISTFKVGPFVKMYNSYLLMNNNSK